MWDEPLKANTMQIAWIQIHDNNEFLHLWGFIWNYAASDIQNLMIFGSFVYCVQNIVCESIIVAIKLKLLYAHSFDYKWYEAIICTFSTKCPMHQSFNPTSTLTPILMLQFHATCWSAHRMQYRTHTNHIISDKSTFRAGNSLHP